MNRTESEALGSASPNRSVVSLTPTAVERDSRTFKQAASVRRLGYHSILVEDVPSRLDKAVLPFRLITPRRRAKPASTSTMRRVGRVTRAWIERRAPAVFTAARNVWHYGPRTAAAMPRAGLYYLHAPHQYLGIWLRSLGRTPFVYDAHDFYPAGYESPPPVQALWFQILLWLERRAVREATEIVTVTEGCAKLMEAYFDRKPIVIPNAHDPRIDEDVTRGLRASLGLDADVFLVVMVGNDKPGTATAEMLAAMRKLPSDVHLALVGHGWDAHVVSIDDGGLSDRVHICGPVPPTQIVPFIATADAAVVLYLALTVDYIHALPNRLFLPIAAGLPLLYPRQLVEIHSVAEKYGLGVPIDPSDVESMVEAISELHGDGALMERLRDGTAAARSDLTWERHEPVLRQILETGLSSQTRA